MAGITWGAALRWRLARQLLEPVGTTSAVEVVDALGAVAAQLDTSAAELGVRMRQRDPAPGELPHAVADGELVRTFAFRGAVHLMTYESAAAHLALRTSARMWERASWRSFYGLEPEDWPALRAVVREALTDGPLTRAELGAAVTAHPRYAHLTGAFRDPQLTFLKPFAWQGDMALGPSRDREGTFRRLDTDPRWPGLPSAEEAGRRAVELYLRAYAPASTTNLEYWLTQGLGVRRAAVHARLAELGDRVATVDVEGEPRLVLAEDVDALRSTAACDADVVVRLLPRYDQWVLGPGTADERVVPAALRPEVSRGADLVVADGVVVGTWSRREDVVTTRWQPTGAHRAALEAEVRRLAEVLGTPLELRTEQQPAP